MTLPLMKCGHTAQGTDGSGAAICAICLGATPYARIPADSPPDLSGRRARCSYSKSGEREHQPGRPGRGWRAVSPQPVPSSMDLPFFAHRPDKPEDSYYCGCWGWD